jgi:hypothetical protein
MLRWHGDLLLAAGKPTRPRRLSGSPLVRYFAGGYSDGRAKSTGRWFVVGGRRVTPLKEALTALADVLAKRPAQEILFDWFRSGRLVGELSVLIKRRHPEVQAEIDRVYQEHLATLGKRRRDPTAQDD